MLLLRFIPSRCVIILSWGSSNFTSGIAPSIVSWNSSSFSSGIAPRIVSLATAITSAGGGSTVAAGIARSSLSVTSPMSIALWRILSTV